MQKPTLEEFNLSQEEFDEQKRKDGKLTTIETRVAASLSLLLFAILFFGYNFHFLYALPIAFFAFIGITLLVVVVSEILRPLISPRNEKVKSYENAEMEWVHAQRDQEIANSYLDDFTKSVAPPEVVKAQKIINKYGKALAERPSLVGKISDLPAPKAKIKQAFYISLKSLIMNDMLELDNKTESLFITTYANLNCFVEDELAEEINDIWQQIEEAKAQDQPIDDLYESLPVDLTTVMPSPESMSELENYISELKNQKADS